MSTRDSEYLLGSSDREHERLIRQAVRIAPLTERFFREAGVGPGQRVLDVGSGVGDVAILAGKLVGLAGEVLGVERDARSVARARQRVAEAAYRNVSFTECDVAQISSNRPFDAVVGRYILQFVPDPVAVLRSLSKLLRPAGVVAFQEPCWVPFLQLCRELPLWSAGCAVIYETSARAGVHMNMGLGMHRVFQDAGLPAPQMHMDIPLGSNRDVTDWMCDILCALLPTVKRFNISLEHLGDFDTLSDRLYQEVVSSNSVVPWIPLVGAWSRT